MKGRSREKIMVLAVPVLVGQEWGPVPVPVLLAVEGRQWVWWLVLVVWVLLVE